MTHSEYEELKERLLNKRNKGNISNKEQGYNEGIECAVSMIREIYKRQFRDEHGKECMCDMMEEQTKESVCDDFSCSFVGTKLCIADSCNGCKLKNCRGCMHLYECIEEDEADWDDETDFI